MNTSRPTEPAVPCLDADPYDEEVLRHPYALQRELRDAGPVVWLTRYDCYAVARLGVVTQVIQNPAQFSSAAGVGLAHLGRPGAWRARSPLVEADPPEHTVLRTAMNRILTPRIVRSWREQFQAQAAQLCDRVFVSPHADGLGDLARPYVQTVFPAALGIEPDSRNFTIVGHHSANAAGPRNRLFEKSLAELESIMEWYEWSQTQEALVAGGFGERVFAAEAAGEIPPGTASPVMRTLVRGGLDTTISGIATTLLLFARHPDQFALVRSDPALVVPAFEEALRLESPTSSVFRTTTALAEVEGIRLRPDAKVQMNIGAANRDPRQWPDAAVFDVTRRAKNTLAFGSGAHNCLGQRIARLEAECLLGEVVKRVAQFELAGEPVWQPVNALRTLERLPLRVVLQ
jgi:4-methoxybenzoate monooxygenase (O-demethylating)